MTAVLQKVNTSKELNSLPMHAEESEWISMMSPVAPKAIWGVAVATVAVGFAVTQAVND